MTLRHDHSKRDIAFILGALVVFGVPVAFTLSSVVGAADAPDPSPYGYTASLTLFAVPVIALAVWHALHPHHDANKFALVGAAAAIAVLGSMLDVAFGYHFLTFADPGATLGIRLPAWDWTQMQWVPSYLPIEEFGFYVLGGFFVIGTYLWLDTNWMTFHDHDQLTAAAKAEHKLLKVSPLSLVILVVLIGAGLLYKRYGAHPYREGFPGYYLFLMAVGFVPTILFFPAVRKFVNWRAFAVSYLLLLLVSVVWEATLGVPYKWWGYNYEQMVGVTIRAWSDLPIEAVLLWLVVSWASVVIYEVLRVYFHMNRPPRHALFGTPKR
jgi:hypothetical protein